MSDRRTALKVLTTAAAGASVGVALIPAAGLVSAPAAGAGTGEGRWITVARLDALTPGRPLKAAVVGDDTDAWTVIPDRRMGAVWLVREGDAVRAYSVLCPHLGCGIELVNGRFACPCHESTFDMHGVSDGGPSPRGLDPMETRVTDGLVAVRFKRYRLGVPERVAIG